MTLQKRRAIGSCDTPFIVQGEDANMLVQLLDQYSGLAVNCSGVDAARAVFLNTDGTTLEKTLGDGVTIESEENGLFTVSLSDAETLLLQPGEAQSFQFDVTVSEQTTIVQFLEALSVRETLFSDASS